MNKTSEKNLESISRICEELGCSFFMEEKGEYIQSRTWLLDDVSVFLDDGIRVPKQWAHYGKKWSSKVKFFY